MKASLGLHCGVRKVKLKSAPVPANCFWIDLYFIFSNPNCTDFTYFDFRSIKTCFLLKGCEDKRPRCTVRDSCVSGRKDCRSYHMK